MSLHKKFICSMCAVATVSAASQFVIAQDEVVRFENTNVEVLTRGPVHEAFAETVVYDNSEPEVVAPIPPPDPIDELPPREAPDAANVTWIPGYWGWDEDRNDYLWVSGVWRAVPPGRQYVSGYWHQGPRGYSWTAGFWADANLDEVTYLPPPPANPEVAPPGSTPAPDVVWVPGSWLWDDGRYAWRAGRWIPANPNWEWVPAHYVAAPQGYLFVDGYWDYTTARRGILFAPVYVTAAARSVPLAYTPSTVIDMAIFTDHLFLRPRYHHYYFGDYYSTNYADVGIYPWFAVAARGVAYDPIYVHRSWVHREDLEWHHHLEENFFFRVQHVEARPPRTLSLQVNLVARPEIAEHHLVVAQPLTKVTARENQLFKFHVVATAEREALVNHTQEVKKARTERNAIESKEIPKPAAAPGVVATPVKAKLPASPVAVKKDVAQAPEHAPPPQPEVAKSRPTLPPSGVPSHPAPQPVTPRPLPPTPTEKKSVEPPSPTRPTPTEPRSIEPKPADAKPLPPRPVEPKPAEPMTPPAKKPTEPPPGEMKKPVEPLPPVKKSPESTPPPARKPPEPMPPTTPRPTELPSQMKKEPSEKRPPDREKDRDDDDDRSGEPTKGKSKKKDDK
ncbi:MAG: YXWGXW repeat-containing protein [Planctomycetes bacterium]|nr:YXWGXW repeat-containing protein [Planctomycetota bacterium]MBI3834632.1 YXWGXW repeat-containing protein [Planctomycetota bacterium]